MSIDRPPSRPLPIDDALAIVAAQVTPLESETVPIAEALGRFLTDGPVAGLDLPPFTNSAMDGYALRAADTPGVLRVIGESAAGAPYEGTLGPGEAVAISTGAVLPAGADAVARIEIVERDDDQQSISLADAVRFDEAIRHAGSDIRRGAQVLSSGVRIGPAQIGAAAAVGLRELTCGRRPRVAVLTTGSELRPPGEQLARGQIYDSNGPMLTALLETAGASVIRIPAAADTADQHRKALSQALEHDVVISSGGVSVGAHDLVREVGRELGVRELFWRVAMRPGKPLSFGARGHTLVFGLPGNPVSTLVGFELFVRPALMGLQGAREIRPEFSVARLAAAVKQNPERDELIRVRITSTGALERLSGQQSHQIAITALSDGLARIPAGAGKLEPGTNVAFLPFHGI